MPYADVVFEFSPTRRVHVTHADAKVLEGDWGRTETEPRLEDGSASRFEEQLTRAGMCYSTPTRATISARLSARFSSRVDSTRLDWRNSTPHRRSPSRSSRASVTRVTLIAL
jgi:hypothetical protein